MTHPHQPDLHAAARALFDIAVKAADPARALRPHLAGLPAIKGRYIVIAVGKAACAMAEEALARLPEGSHTAIAVTNPENLRPVTGCTVLPAAHPVPDENGAKAAQAVIDLLETATADDHVLALISGGGSALLPAPLNGITLADKAEVSRILLAAGFEITEMNLVRQHLSRLKGGGMARLAQPARLTACILSDVIGDDLRAIASGPTVAPIGPRAQARELLQQRGVFDRMPAAVRTALQSTEPEPPAALAENILIGSNRQSLAAVQAASGGIIISDSLTGDVENAANFIVRAISGNPAGTLIFGGETTVNLKGDGKGGRNQELALRVALQAGKIPGAWVFLSGGTDGRDGPTDAAGGIVDPHTVAKIPNARTLLANNDSYTALKMANALLMTGGTGTNVADVQIFVRR